MWGLANSVEIYSVLLNQDTFLACCLALDYPCRWYTSCKRDKNKEYLFDSGCCTTSSSKSASSAEFKVTENNENNNNYCAQCCSRAAASENIHVVGNSRLTIMVGVDVCIWKDKVNRNPQVNFSLKFVFMVPL